MKFKEQFLIVSRDREYIIAWFFAALVLLAIVIMGAIQIRVSDLQIPIRYSSFGITNFYRDKWFYELTFIAFAIFMLGFHSLASLRLYTLKGRTFALAFLWLTVAMLVITGLTIFAILRVVSFSQ